MTNKAPDTPHSLHFPFHRLQETVDGVTITKNKAILNRKFALVLLLIALVVGLFWSLPKQSPTGLPKAVNLTEILLLSGFALFIGITLYLSFRRLKRLVADFKLYRREDSVYLNDELLVLGRDSEQALVVIQDVAGWKGIGGSYTVGIAVGKKFWGLCYELDKTDAAKAAKFISSHLGLTLEQREAATFPLFKLH